MGTPELHRSGHTPVSPDHASEVADTSRGKGGGPGAAPLPPANRPGHHPDIEQDKPTRRPRSRRTAEATTTGPGGRFDFAFDDRLRPIARLFTVTPSNAYVEVGDGRLTIHFGRWSLRTALANVAGTSTTGPYDWWKVAGPAHLSLADGGITFATSTSQGLCISFHEPVPALVPTPAIRHSTATVTVVDPDSLARQLRAADAR
jgi:hypothetical protein